MGATLVVVSGEAMRKWLRWVATVVGVGVLLAMAVLAVAGSRIGSVVESEGVAPW